jgi:hypothetical protein
VKKKRQVQIDLPGCEPDQAGALQRKADAPLKPRKPQEPCDLGLFSDENKQGDLIDQLGMMKPKIGAEAAVICTGYYYESDCRRSRRIPTRLVEL